MPEEWRPIRWPMANASGLKDVSGSQTPWVAGDYAFVISNGRTLDGPLEPHRWVRGAPILPANLGRVRSWVAGGFLPSAASGKLVSVSAQTGQVLNTSELGGILYSAGDCQRHRLSFRRRCGIDRPR